ncbi:hypothetical protein AVEN_144808-1 [Araneus ventricosus]|uniref:Uncharacterized protein n=1 Tax=Araneus ventricosus TaxID=182803 RepID=A0A4Y2MX87_ARAVE|nr:hypothetical protein AVEN_144808-1 [Araneus ventricosus]
MSFTGLDVCYDRLAISVGPLWPFDDQCVVRIGDSLLVGSTTDGFTGFQKFMIRHTLQIPSDTRHGLHFALPVTINISNECHYRIGYNYMVATIKFPILTYFAFQLISKVTSHHQSSLIQGTNWTVDKGAIDVRTPKNLLN